MTRFSAILFLALTTLGLGFAIPAAAIPGSPDQERAGVLVLHSYSPDFAWTRSQQEGIDAVFRPLAAEYNLRIEYLDAVHHPALLKGHLILDLLEAKLTEQRPRVVLTSDNAAFAFARAHRSRLFPDATIVFMGLNGYEESVLRGETNITGVAEDSDLPGTLRVLLQLRPLTKRIVFPGMADDITYRAIRATVTKDLAALPPHVATEFPEYPDVDAALDAMRKLPPDAAIVVMTNMRTRKGEGINSQRVVELVSAAAHVPVFTNWDFVVGQGAVGGSVISGVEQGRQAAEIALQVLRGERPESIPVRRGAGKKLLFDYRQLARFEIPASQLPPEAEVLFSPERTLRISREAAWTAAISFALLLGVTASLVLAVRRRQRAEEEVRALNQQLEGHVGDREATIQARTAELRQQARYLRTLIDMLPMRAWFKDTQNRYLVANHAHAEACASPPDAMIGKTDLDLMPTRQALARHADDEEVMASRRRKTTEERVADGDDARWMETYRAAVVDEDGTLLGTVGVSQDISERRAAEAARSAALAEAQRLVQLRSDFMARVSHELRTPLNGILGYAQILQRDESLDEQEKTSVAIIRRSGEQLLALINDILDFAKVEAGKIEVVPGDFDLRCLLRSVLDTVRIRAEQKGLPLICDIADVPDAIRADERLLSQVLLNLLTNAIKFTDRGQIVLHVTRLGSGRLRFAVEDSGTGIAPERMEAIFQPFEQAGEPGRHTDGTGLGLAISRHFVERMGGSIQVASTPGEGSTFWFDIDVVPVDAGLESRAPDAALIVGYEGPRKTILAVDDLPECHRLIADMLRPLGFDVLTAGRGEEALDVVQTCRPDLILIDAIMPGIDGYAVTRRLRKTPGLESIPIIGVSASASSLDRENYALMGADGFLAKPVKLDALLDILAQMLGLRWTTRSPCIADRPGHELANHSAEIVAPPKEDMKILHDLALQGNMREIQRHAAILLAGDPRHRAFARRLQQLAGNYQSKATLDLVERHFDTQA